MEEDKKLILEETFDTAQNILGAITKTGSSLIQSGVQATDDFIDKNIPGGEQYTANWRKGALRFVGASARFVQEELEAADRQVDRPIDHIGDIPYFVAGSFNRGKQQYTENAQRLAEFAGIDPRAGNVLGEVAGEIAAFGGGKLASNISKVIPPGTGGMSPQLATAGSAPMSLAPSASNGSITLRPQVMPITVEPKFRAPGITEGVSQQPAFREALDRRESALKDVRDNQARRISQGKTPSKYIKEEAGKGSTLDYNPDDIIVFEKNRYKVYDPADPQRYAHQHHLFGKAQSYPFVEKMEDLIAKGIADEDDLVAMFAWADMLDVTMGNTRKNMLDAPGRSHISAAPGSTQLDKTRNIHTILKEFDLELTGNQVRNLVADATDATDLMERFNNYIVESIKPQKMVAQNIVEDFLVRHRKSLPTEQLTLFDDLSSKLGGRIQR